VLLSPHPEWVAGRARRGEDRLVDQAPIPTSKETKHVPQAHRAGRRFATFAALALVAVPANAARSMDDSGEGPIFSSQPTGTHTMEAVATNNYETGDEYEGCQQSAHAANGYLDVARQWEAKGYPALAQYMEQRADEIAGEANKEGCNLIQPE
jgi:hypothetical protein